NGNGSKCVYPSALGRALKHFLRLGGTLPISGGPRLFLDQRANLASLRPIWHRSCTVRSKASEGLISSFLRPALGTDAEFSNRRKDHTVCSNWRPVMAIYTMRECFDELRRREAELLDCLTLWKRVTLFKDKEIVPFVDALTATMPRQRYHEKDIFA